jgi:hypothetical protein
MAFVNADTADDQGPDAAQQEGQPGAPPWPDYASQAPYAEGPEGPYPEGPNPEGPNPDQGYPPPRAPYNPQAYGQPAQGSPADQSATAQNNGLDHPAVTLVFNDGRPPMQVHSYALTSSSVFVAESGRQRIIPIADLDLPATIAQNRDAGVDFELPGGNR